MRLVWGILLIILFPAELRAEQWAAQTPYGGGVGPVQWGSTEAEAEANAHKLALRPDLETAQLAQLLHWWEIRKFSSQLVAIWWEETNVLHLSKRVMKN